MNHVTPSTLAVAPPVPKKEPGPWLRAWRKLKRNRKGMFGLYVVLLFIAMAIFAPLISPFDPIEASWSAIRKAPTSTHWFGTDELGRDVLARVVWGTRASL